MNVHVAQDPEADAEVASIMSIKECVMNSQTNRNLMGAVYDAGSLFYKMTEPGRMIHPDDYTDCLELMTNKRDLPTLEERLRKHNVPPLSGAALFSALLPHDFFYEKGNVLILDGVLVKGQITLDHIGNTHNSIVQKLWRDKGSDRVSDFLTDAPFVSDRWGASVGFTASLKDCFPLNDDYKTEVTKTLNKARLAVAAMGPRTNDPLEEVRRETTIRGYVDSVKNMGTALSTKSLAPDNNFNVMANSGAKGGPSNIGQMMVMLGQQFLGGQRIKPSMTGGTRILPYYAECDPSLEASGFCEHPLLVGLTPAEYFFHHMGSRESLIDIALNVSTTGYMHRRLGKALEDVRVAYDGSTRNAAQTMFQPVYGEDGFEGSELQMVDTPAGNVASFVDIKSLAREINNKYGYAPGTY